MVAIRCGSAGHRPVESPHHIEVGRVRTREGPAGTVPIMIHRPRPLRAAAALCGLIALTGCASLQSSDNFLGVVTPYRIDIVQGNVVTKEQAALIKPGMSRAQVRDILGSPLLTDAFHGDRWDYVFTIRRQGTEPQLRRIVVRFDGEKLKSMDTSGELPSEREFVASVDATKTSPRSTPLELTEAQIKALPVPPQPAASAAEPDKPERSYPPLETTK
jgi:outer membrane protein assembly factor BamE